MPIDEDLKCLSESLRTEERSSLLQELSDLLVGQGDLKKAREVVAKLDFLDNKERYDWDKAKHTIKISLGIAK